MSLLPQVGGLEMLLVGVVGLLVLGPHDLPQLVRTAGRLLHKAQTQAAHFRRELMELAPRADLEELRTEVERLRMISAADPFNLATGWVGDVAEPKPASGREARVEAPLASTPDPQLN